jgi:hypothetical protein
MNGAWLYMRPLWRRGESSDQGVNGQHSSVRAQAACFMEAVAVNDRPVRDPSPHRRAAALAGREFVIPDVAKATAVPALAQRLTLRSDTNEVLPVLTLNCRRRTVGDMPDGNGGWLPAAHQPVLDAELFDQALPARQANRPEQRNDLARRSFRRSRFATTESWSSCHKPI